MTNVLTCISVQYLFVRMKKIGLRDIQSYLTRNEKDIIQVMLAAVLILYMVMKNISQ